MLRLSMTVLLTVGLVCGVPARRACESAPSVCGDGRLERMQGDPCGEAEDAVCCCCGSAAGREPASIPASDAIRSKLDPSPLAVETVDDRLPLPSSAPVAPISEMGRLQARLHLSLCTLRI